MTFIGAAGVSVCLEGGGRVLVQLVQLVPRHYCSRRRYTAVARGMSKKKLTKLSVSWCPSQRLPRDNNVLDFNIEVIQ